MSNFPGELRYNWQKNELKQTPIGWRNVPLDSQVPHDGRLVLLHDGTSPLVIFLHHEPNGILINIVHEHNSLKKSVMINFKCLNMRFQVSVKFTGLVKLLSTHITM